MPGQFGTDTERMTTTSGRVHTTADSVDARLRTMQNQLGMLAGAWVGDTSNAFHRTMAEWRTQADRLVVNLRAMGDQIGASGQRSAVIQADDARSFGHGGGAISQALG